MKVGFTINLGTSKEEGTTKYEFLRVDSSEHEDGMNALKELYNFLKQFDHYDVKRFVSSFYGSRVKPEVKPTTPKMKDGESIAGKRRVNEAHGGGVKKRRD